MDISTDLQGIVKQAIDDKTALNIYGGRSKAFYGNLTNLKRDLDVSGHTGIISYEPSELFVRARAGTTLVELEKALTDQNQILPFDPPIHNERSTIGGIVATGLSGPRRPYASSVRDAVLGVRVISGQGEILEFGGQVMKNVAGYDVSRLMTGSLGTLGVILDVSLKVIPKPEQDITLALESTVEESLEHFQELHTSHLPVSATCYYDGLSYIRLSGSAAQIEQYQSPEQGFVLPHADEFWDSVRNHTHPFFSDPKTPLWRFLAPLSAPLTSRQGGEQLIEWSGGQRWIKTNTPTNVLIGMAKKHNGHISLYRGAIAGVSSFVQPEPALMALYKSVKRQLDPHRIFNPDRMYEGL